MKSLPNQTHASLPIWSVPHAVVFEVAIAIISALVIFTSCWVLKYVYLKKTRSITDLLFAITSITNIGVGFLRLPFAGVDVACTTFIKCSATIPANKCFQFFSCLFLFQYNSYRNRQTTSHNEALQVQNVCYNRKIEDNYSILLCFKYWIYFSCCLLFNIS